MSSCCTVQQIEEYVSGRLADEATLRHIETCERCQANVQRVRENNALMAELAETVSPASPAALHFAADSIEGYEILSEVHRGGQGIVYKAVQKATKRTVALKVLTEGAFASPKQRYRFEREIDLVAHLNHPNVVTLYDSGETSDGRQYFAMEYIHGVPLDRYLGADASRGLKPHGSLSLKERLRLFAAICSAVNHAHQRGVTHRDLKPGNILIDANGDPHVVDFGLAKAPGAAWAREPAPMTMTGEFMGTLAYAAPEQLKGDPALIDIRTDVYALGVVLYEILTGRRPHAAEGSMMDVLNAITGARTTHPRLSRAALARAMHPRKLKHAAQTATGIDSVHEPINDELDTIVLKALAKDKDRRYQTADALRADIDRYLAGEAIEAKRDSSWYVLSKTLKRHKAPVGVLFGVMALLVVFGITMSVMYGIQVQERERADRNAAKANNTVSLMQDLFSFASPFEDMTGAGGETTLREFVDYAAGQIREESNGDPLVRATALAIIGRVYVELGLPNKGLPLLKDTLQIREKHLGSTHLDVVDSLLRLGEAHEGLSEYDEAEKMYTRARTIAEQTKGEDSKEFAEATHFLADVVARDDPSEAEHLYQQALTIRLQVLGDNHPDVAETLHGLGSLCDNATDCDPAQAERYYRDALAIRKAAFPPGNAYIIETLNNLGVLLTVSEPQTAEKLFTRALEKKSEILERLPYTARMLGNLGAALDNLGDPEGAERRYRNAIQILDDVGSHPFATEIHYNLALLLWDKNKDEAEIHLRKALALVRKFGGSNGVSSGLVRTQLADLLRHMEQYDKAASLADELIEEFRGTANADPLDLADALSVRGKVALDQDQPAAAEPLLRECFKLRQKTLGEADLSTVGTAERLGDCLIKLGEYAEAESILLGSFQAVRDQDRDQREIKELITRLIRLHKDIGKPDEAARYRALLPDPVDSPDP